MRLRGFWLLLLSLIAYVVGDGAEEDLKRRNKEHEEFMRAKRQINSLPLVYPYGSTFRLILGLGTPMKVEENINLVFGAAFLYQYSQFANITELSQYYAINTVSREQRHADWDARKDERLVFYKAAEEMMNLKGFNGLECVQRAICEAAQYPVKDEGLLGELIHILLTPNYGQPSFVNQDPDRKESINNYLDAYTAGSQMFSCPFIYSGCPEGEGVLELFSLLRDE